MVEILEHAIRKVDALAERSERLNTWWQHISEMPQDVRAVERFEKDVFIARLNDAIGGWEQVKQHLADAVEECMRHRGWLAIERPEISVGPPTWLRRSPGAEAPTGILVYGPQGTAKVDLMYAAAEAMGRRYRNHYIESSEDSELWKGWTGVRRGRITGALAETGICNPVMLLHGIDRARAATGEVINSAMERPGATGFVDDYLEVPWDVSEILWLTSAVDMSKVPVMLQRKMHLVKAEAQTHADRVAVVRHRIANTSGRSQSQPGELCLDGDNTRIGWNATEKRGTGLVIWDGELAQGDRSEALEESELYQAGEGMGITSEAAEELVRLHGDTGTFQDLCRMSDRVHALCVRERATSRAGGPGDLQIRTEDVLRHYGTGGERSLPRAVRDAIDAEREIRTESDKENNTVNDRWIDWLENVPWTGPPAPILAAATIIERLDRTHAGREEAKRRLAHHISGHRDGKVGSVMCLAGPPGVGKTSLAQATADAAGRPLVRLACGGWRDETDLRGHNRTWRGAQPGWILREIRRVKCRWPIFLLDEIDKMGNDPAGVLLEVFDPTLRHAFRDAFLELAFDLSQVVFITTANDTTRIVPALRDRLDIVELNAYTDDEKVEIAVRQMLPKAAEAAGLSGRSQAATRAACIEVVTGYTREQGVRELERRLTQLCLQAANTGTRLPIQSGDIRRLLGHARRPDEDASGTLAKHIAQRQLPPNAYKGARRAMRVIENDTTSEGERNRARNYIETLVAMPWGEPAQRPDGRAATRADTLETLDGAIEGQEKAKSALTDRATAWNGREAGITIPCLSGAAGTGKSTLAEACATATGRMSVAIDCRTLSDTEKIDGHQHTGAGEITRALCRGQGRPVLLILEHIDEVSQGQGIGAVAAMLNARSRGTFVDRYLGIEIDIENYPMIATARRFEKIGKAIAEHLQRIAVRGYTNSEKAQIARRIWPHLTSQNRKRLNAAVLDKLIEQEPEHAGMWRMIAKLEKLETAGKDVSRKRASGRRAARRASSRSGRALGLYVDAQGAGVMLIDAGRSAGSGKVTLSGQQNQAMAESVQSSRQWLIERTEAFGLQRGWEGSTDLHVHAGNVAEPKGGGSAALAMAAALASAMTGRRIRDGVALTGALALGDEVGPVGNVTEKLIGAARAGMKQVHVPKGNRRRSRARERRLKSKWSTRRTLQKQSWTCWRTTTRASTRPETGRHEPGCGTRRNR